MWAVESGVWRCEGAHVTSLIISMEIGEGPNFRRVDGTRLARKESLESGHKVYICGGFLRLILLSLFFSSRFHPLGTDTSTPFHLTHHLYHFAMGAGGVVATSADTGRVEAPVTWKAYFMCAFAAFGGICFGFDSGYISGVLAMPYWIHIQTGLPYPAADDVAANAAFVISTSHKSLIVSILSAGTFFGAILAGDLADWFGRRTTVILGCLVYGIGCVLQTASSGIGLLVAGRIIAGFGVGFISAVIILYMSEVAPKSIRGAIVSGKKTHAQSINLDY